MVCAKNFTSDIYLKTDNQGKKQNKQKLSGFTEGNQKCQKIFKFKISNEMNLTAVKRKTNEKYLSVCVPEAYIGIEMGEGGAQVLNKKGPMSIPYSPMKGGTQKYHSKM